MECTVTPQGRRNLFWSTQPEACGSDMQCGSECANPGLQIENGTISTSNWIRGLLINMLMTNGRLPESQCGYVPGSQRGHWSESFMTQSPGLGTLMRSIEAPGSVNSLSNLLNAYAQDTVNRLVLRGVAISTEVTTSYVGNGRFEVNIVVVGRSNETTNVSLSGEQLGNSWVWNT